jgi:hypothetical protein
MNLAEPHWYFTIIVMMLFLNYAQNSKDISILPFVWKLSKKDIYEII